MRGPAVSRKASAELRAEIGMAISRLTQIITNDEPLGPPQRTYLVGDSQMSVWIDLPDLQVLTEQGDSQAVFVRGKMVDRFHPSDLYALRPPDAIAIGEALVAAGLAATTGQVVRITG